MTNYKTSRIITVAFSLILVAVAIAVIVSFVRASFFSGSGGSTTTTDVSKETLLNTAANRSVIMKVRGKIVADEDFRSYQIKITPNSRIMTTYSGYTGDVLSEESLNNNIPAYEQFVYALYHANMTSGTTLTGEVNDSRGVCANGKLYEFEVLKDGKSVKTLWTTSCSGIRGSLSSKARASQIERLFTSQIPDSDKIIDKLW